MPAELDVFRYVARSFAHDAGFFVIALTAAWILAMILARRSPTKAARGLLVLLTLGLGLLGAVTLDGTARTLARPLVKAVAAAAPHSACSESTRAPTLVVLSGGIESTTVPALSTMFRLEEAAAILGAASRQSQPHSYRWVVLSGGVGDPELGVSEASVMGQALRQRLGLEHQAATSEDQPEILLEEESLTTFENAQRTKVLLSKIGAPDHIDLVTSAEHMWRAHGTFASQGFRVCPREAMPRRYNSNRLFSFRQAALTIEVLHEWLGLVGYTLSGRIKLSNLTM